MGMNKLPSIVLRIIILLAVAAGAAVCVFALPDLGTALAKHFPGRAFWRYPIIAGLYAAAGCFFFALYQFWLLLNSVDRDNTLPANRLRAIRLSAIVFSVLYALCAMPVVFLAAEADDAPGLILLGAVLDAFPLGIAAAAAILERSIAAKALRER